MRLRPQCVVGASADKSISQPCTRETPALPIGKVTPSKATGKVAPRHLVDKSAVKASLAEQGAVFAIERTADGLASVITREEAFVQAMQVVVGYYRCKGRAGHIYQSLPPSAKCRFDGSEVVHKDAL